VSRWAEAWRWRAPAGFSTLRVGVFGLHKLSGVQGTFRATRGRPRPPAKPTRGRSALTEEPRLRSAGSPARPGWICERGGGVMTQVDSGSGVPESLETPEEELFAVEGSVG
jgi:hypothetical protein